MSKILQSGRFCGSLLGKYADPLIKVWWRSGSTIDGAIQWNMHGRGIVRAGKEMTLTISNEGMDNIIRVIKSLENLGGLIDGVSEIVKHKIKRQKGWFLGTLTGKGVMWAVTGIVGAGTRYNEIDHMDLGL